MRTMLFVLALLALTLVIPATAAAETLVVRDNELDVTDGVLRLAPPGGGCCEQNPCDGSFILESVSVESLGPVVLGINHLLGRTERIPSHRVVLAPPGLPGLPQSGQITVKASLALGSDLPAGSYRGTIAARELRRGAPVILPLTVELCPRDPTEPGSTLDPSTPGTPATRSDQAATGYPGDPGDPGDEGDEGDETGTPDDPLQSDPYTDPGPLPEPGPVALTLEQTASRNGLRVGEVFTLHCTLTNPGGATARDLVLAEALPPGLTYVAERTAIDGRPGPEPEREPGGLRWSLPDLGPGAESTLSFQVVVTPSMPLGRATARAWIRSDAVRVGPAEVELEITRTSMRPFGSVHGSVRAVGGSPVAGIRLLLDADRETVTGQDGRFRFDGVLDGEHLVSLDERTLAPGERVESDDAQLLHLFAGLTEEVHFVVVQRPRLTFTLRRVRQPQEELSSAE